ncbi:MAG: hypothetical protein ACRD4R_05865 [Candidatus Acidiferrales bacterium]
MNLDGRRLKHSPHASAVSLGACILALAFVAMVAAASARARQSESPAVFNLHSYVGTWKASFQGKVFAILVLRERHGSLEGTLNNFAIAFDRQGNLADGTHIDIGVSPIISPRFDNGSLIFTVAQKDAYSQTTDWSFVVKNDREGQLTENLDNQLEAPMSMIVKPIPMRRVSTH